MNSSASECTADMQSEPRKNRRTANACIPCRQSKIKCSGEEPCANCQRRIVRCRFEDGRNKVMVSARYLQQLHARAQGQQTASTGLLSPTSQNYSQVELSRAGTADQQRHDQQPSSSIGVGLANCDTFPQPLGGFGLRIQTNPFLTPSATIKNTHENSRSWIWLAPSSTWSFTVRLTLMLTAKLNIQDPGTPIHPKSDTYPLKWKSRPEDELPDITGLPSIDHALYLFDTVKFHLGQHYRFFDETKFLQHVNEFYYGNGQEKASQCRLWFAQFLLIVAFGMAFLSQSSSQEPPGAKYFVRAMALIPDLASLWKDSLLAIEVLAQAGLYLYSIDHRESAHVYVGQALRIAQLEGLHTQLPEEELGPNVVARCRDLWWTVYIMDRHFSISLGLPMSTSDSDITTLSTPSNSGSREDTILSLQAKLWHLLSVILTTIYKTDNTELSLFLGTTRSILHTLAGHAQEIENIISVKFQNSVETMSKGTRHITLLYHQCVIVATRPLLLSVLNERLEKLGHGDEDWKAFFALTTTLISTGIKSAVKTFQILSYEHSPLELFLPFDLEFTYGAALHFIMASTLFAGVADDKDYTQQAHEILDKIISKGNRVAKVRKSELLHLQSLCRELAKRSEHRGLQTLTLDGAGDIGSGAGDVESGASGDLQQVSSPLGPRTVIDVDDATAGPVSTLPDLDPRIPSNTDFLDDIGISSGDFFSIVDEMSSQDIFLYPNLDAHVNPFDAVEQP